METANEVFIKEFLKGMEEAENAPEGRDSDEDIFFKILNAGTVGELYGMDISLEDVERLIPKTELLLRKAEGSFWFCRFMTDSIHKVQGQKRRNKCTQYLKLIPARQAW